MKYSNYLLLLASLPLAVSCGNNQPSTEESSDPSTSETSTSESSSYVAPTSIQLHLDKNQIDKDGKVIVSLEVTGGDEPIVPVVASNSPVKGAITPNEDGTYTLVYQQSNNIGCLIFVEARSKVDPSVFAKETVQVIAPIKEKQDIFFKTFNQFRNGGKDFAGVDITSLEGEIKESEDHTHATFHLNINDVTYDFVSVYQTRWNEVYFANVDYDGSKEGLEFVTAKPFSTGVEISGGRALFTMMSETPLISVTLKEKTPSLTKEVRVGDSLILQALPNEGFTTDEVTYSWSVTGVTEGYVTSALYEESDMFDQVVVYPDRLVITPLEAGIGQSFSVYVTATNQNDDSFFSETLTYSILEKESQEEELSFNSDLLGEWQDDYGFYGLDVLSSSLEPTLEEIQVTFYDLLEEVTFPTENLSLVSGGISFTLGTPDVEDSNSSYYQGDSLSFTYDELEDEFVLTLPNGETSNLSK